MKTIKQIVYFKAKPEDVYDALMDSKKHSLFTGDKAVISKKVGGKFSAYGNYIKGKNVKLVPGKIIVQEWAGSDWPKGHVSRVTYILKKDKKGTRLDFKHEDVPADQVKSIEKGWKDFYWNAMKDVFDW